MSVLDMMKLVEEYRERLLEKAEEYNAERASDEVEAKVEKERSRIDSLVEYGKMKLSGSAYKAHIEKFKKDAYKNIFDRLMEECAEDIERDVEEYRKSLEDRAE